MPEPLLVDVEAEFAAFLRGHAAITALVGDRVYGAIPAEPTWPLVTVRRVGGGLTTADGPEDLPSLQVDCWADTDDTDAAGKANLMARTVVSVLPDLADPQLQGANVTSFIPLTDPDTARERVAVTVELNAYP